MGCQLWDSWRLKDFFYFSDVEFEEENISVLDDVFLAFRAE
jgi:hypothetical protein